MLNRLKTVSKTLFMPGGSLLFPMLILALGIHAALLAMPIPSSESMPEAEDKKNPITVNQIPTEQPAKPANLATKPTSSVDVPALVKTPPVTSSASEDTTPSSPTTSSSTNYQAASVSDSKSSTSHSAKASTNPLSASSSSSPENTPIATGEQPAETTIDDRSTSQPVSESANSSATIATNSTPSLTNIATNPFPEFPHYQPSEADCYGLGFGESCHIVDSREMAQVTTFFRKELVAKNFTVSLVKDEPNRKVFKVEKGDKFLFLNIWQGKDKVSYLLSKEVLNQSPEDIKAGSSK